jgi:dTMP kinase
VLDIEVETLSSRLAKRAGASDRYEQLDKDFHSRVINGFRDIAKNNPRRCYLINSSNSLNETHNQILEKTQEYLANSL